MEQRQYIKNGAIRTFRYDDGRLMTTIQIGGTWISNPRESALLADGWEHYEAPAVEPAPAYVPEYKDRVSQLIRERYTEDDEDMFARWSWEDRIGKSELTEEQITRMRDFSDYVEECKRIAKQETI